MRPMAELLLGTIAMRPSEDRGNEEEDAVHDAKGEGSLEHGASLVNAHIEADEVGGAEDAERDIVRITRDDFCAVGIGDEA